MEKERRVKVLSVIALIVAVLGLTIAFASLSQNLKINGTAEMNPVNWDVRLENLREADIREDAKVNKMPTIGSDGLTLNGLDVTLTKPGDEVNIFVDIKNGGEIDAKLSDILFSGISMVEANEICSNEFNQEKCNDINNKLLKEIFPEADWDGDGITTEEERNMVSDYIQFSNSFRQCASTATSCESDFNIDSILKPGESIILNIWVSFIAENLPKGNVRLNLDSKLIFIQS